MSCKICGRGSCTPSFHKIEEQEKFEEFENVASVMETRDIINMLIELEEANNTISWISDNRASVIDDYNNEQNEG